MIQVKLQDPKTVELDMSGEVTAQDYVKVRPQLEKIFREKGKMKFLIDLSAVEKFTAGSVFQDIKFDLEHLKFIGTTAVVSSRKIYELITKVSDKFYPEKIVHFDHHRAAQDWILAQN